MSDQMGGAKDVTGGDVKVGIMGFVALAFAIIFFSGVFREAEGAWRVLDFNHMLGTFGRIGDGFEFRGRGGTSARDGFLFALSLIPAVMLALGTVSVVTKLGALAAAQKLLSPILRPILGIPGICTLALVSNLQSTDAGAAMMKALADNGDINEKERTIFAAFQFSWAGTITNYFGSGVALFPMLVVPIGLPLLVGLVFKVVGANLMRLYLAKSMSIGGYAHGTKQTARHS